MFHIIKVKDGQRAKKKEKKERGFGNLERLWRCYGESWKVMGVLFELMLFPNKPHLLFYLK